MISAPENSLWLEKTRELCAFLVALPEFNQIRSSVERFAASPTLPDQLTQLNEQGESLQERQELGEPLEDSEVEEFEALRESFIENPVARDFLDAQEAIRRFQVTVGEHVAKTFELGRVPVAEDFAETSDDDCDCDPE